MKKQVVVAIVVGALIVGGGGYYVVGNRAKTAAAKSAIRYLPTVVKRGDIRSTISGSGPVASVNGVMVRANQSGTVSQILAQDGTRVTAGQVIMTLQNDTLTGSLKQAQVDRVNAQATVDTLLSPVDTALQTQRLKVENARSTLQQRQQDAANLTVLAPVGGIVTSVATLEGSNVNANALLFTLFNDQSPTFVVLVPQLAALSVSVGQRATVELPGFGRLEGIVQASAGSATPASNNRDANVPITISLPQTPGIRPGMVGQATITAPGLTYAIQGAGSIKNDVVEVRAQVVASVGQLAVKEGARVKAGDLLSKLTNDNLLFQQKQAENDVKTQEQNLVNLIDPSQDPTGNLRTSQSKVESTQITLANRQSDVNELQVKAPVSGVISAATPRVGDRISVNQSLFRVADYGQMQITITVDELDVAKAKVGQTAQITLDALPNRPYTGKVTKINPEGVFKNDIAIFEVTITVDKTDGLMAGMNATVNIVVEQKTGLYLPAQAVKVQKGQATVQLQPKGTALPVIQDVKVGLRTSTQVEILSGLNEGDQVVQSTIRPSTTGAGGLFGGGATRIDGPGPGVNIKDGGPVGPGPGGGGPRPSGN